MVTFTVPTGNTSILFPQNLLLILASDDRGDIRSTAASNDTTPCSWSVADRFLVGTDTQVFSGFVVTFTCGPMT